MTYFILISIIVVLAYMIWAIHTTTPEEVNEMLNDKDCQL